MRPTFFLPAGFQLAATVMLAIVPVIFAIPSPELLSPRNIQFRDLVPPSFGDGFPGLGCFTDDNDLPTLTSVFYSDPQMTASLCGKHCYGLYNKLFGVANGQNCRCGNVTADRTTPASPALCNIQCPGNSTQNCGGKDTIAIYGSISQPPATFVQNVGPWTFSGCFNDNDNAKTLAVQKSGLGGQFNNTVENCVDVCEGANFKFAGVGDQGGKYCWCDNQINEGKTPLLDSSSCMTPCPGDNRELCGGPDSLIIYKT